MNREEIIKMALDAGFFVEKNHVFANSEIGHEHALCTEAIIRFAQIVAASERKAIYDIVLIDTLKDPSVLMDESEVDDDDADDFFKSSEFRYAMNNTVKATLFTITKNIRARGNF